MAVNLNQMIAYVQVIIQNQLTDQQVTSLVNLAELEELVQPDLSHAELDLL